MFATYDPLLDKILSAPPTVLADVDDGKAPGSRIDFPVPRT